MLAGYSATPEIKNKTKIKLKTADSFHRLVTSRRLKDGHGVDIQSQDGAGKRSSVRFRGQVVVQHVGQSVKAP